ncbi:Hypothetical predicted protein, partial [Paramuricea clavata]
RSLSVILDGNMLAQVKQAKVLGLTLDEFLIWTKHIDNLCSTINSRLALLRRIKHFLTKDCALRFYNSCINSSLIYFASVFATDNLSDQSEELSTDPLISEVIVSELEIETLLKTLDSNKATGPDEIPARLLK